MGILISTLPFVCEGTSGDEVQDKTLQVGKGSEQKPSKKIQKGFSLPVESECIVVSVGDMILEIFSILIPPQCQWYVNIYRPLLLSVYTLKTLKGNHETGINSQKRELFQGIIKIG